MSLMLIIFGGVLTSMATMMFLFKLDIRKVLYFEVTLDLIFDLLIPIMFIGTFSGMLVAIIAGVLNSIVMYVLKHYVVGYKKLQWSWKKGCHWVDVPPSKAWKW